MSNLSKDEFRLLKDRMYRTSNALSLAIRSCPELGAETFQFNDGRRISLLEILEVLDAARGGVWKHGPTEVQLRHVRTIVREQPRG